MNVMQTILGSFALILFVLTIITGIIWCLDVFYLAKQRRAAANAALEEYDARQARLKAEGIKMAQGEREELETRLMRQPTWIEYSGSFFPVIALVFFLRSFLYEPFKIPSESMVPTLLVGDLILVNKFTYGIRLPIINKKIVEINNPQRGDVMVFKYPVDNSTDYIKRVVGTPGDKIEYRNKRLSINGKELSYQKQEDYLSDQRLTYSLQLTEDLTGVQHRILNDGNKPTYEPGGVSPMVLGNRACQYDSEGFVCTVPAGQYFMMGDNRDNSADSRYWGFVPDQNIVGKAFFVWMNFGSLKRIGTIH
jgi:signal peptidase I